MRRNNQKKKLGPIFSTTLGPLFSTKPPNIGPNFYSTTYIYVYIYIFCFLFIFLGAFIYLFFVSLSRSILPTISLYNYTISRASWQRGRTRDDNARPITNGCHASLSEAQRTPPLAWSLLDKARTTRADVNRCFLTLLHALRLHMLLVIMLPLEQPLNQTSSILKKLPMHSLAHMAYQVETHMFYIEPCPFESESWRAFLGWHCHRIRHDCTIGPPYASFMQTIYVWSLAKSQTRGTTCGTLGFWRTCVWALISPSLLELQG